MNKLILLPALFIFGFATGDEVTADRALEQLRDKLESGVILHGEMEHVFEDQHTGNVEEHSGQIWIGKDRYKIDVGTQQVLVIDDVSRVYNETDNRLIVSTYEPEEDDFAPSRLLNLSEDVFSISQEREGGTIKIHLSTEDPFELLRTVDIELNEELVPLSIKALDQTENKYTTTFKEARFEDWDDDVFTLDYPDDAEVVDLRD